MRKETVIDRCEHCNKDFVDIDTHLKESKKCQNKKSKPTEKNNINKKQNVKDKNAKITPIKTNERVEPTTPSKPNVSEKYSEFIPTEEFQELKSWQRVPMHCIIEMNTTTGKNRVKLDPKYVQDPNYGLPPCLRKQVPVVTPSRNESSKMAPTTQSKPVKKSNVDKAEQNNVDDLAAETPVNKARKNNIDVIQSDMKKKET